MIEVLFFGKVAEIVGIRRTQLAAMSETRWLFDIRARFVDPSLNIPVLMSVNQQMTKDNQEIHTGDEVAFFSVFSGG